MIENPMGAPKNGGIRLLFDRHLRLEFRGAKITTDAGLLALRELDETMGLTEMAADLIEDNGTGKNIQHRIPGLLRQSAYASLAGYETLTTTKGFPARGRGASTGLRERGELWSTIPERPKS